MPPVVKANRRIFHFDRSGLDAGCSMGEAQHGISWNARDEVEGPNGDPFAVDAQAHRDAVDRGPGVVLHAHVQRRLPPLDAHRFVEPH